MSLRQSMLEPEEGIKQQKTITRSEYEAVEIMGAEGCPNCWDLDDFRVVEDKPEPLSKTFVAC